MSLPSPVRQSVVVTAATLVAAFVFSMVHPDASDILGLGVAASLINGAGMAFLLYRVTQGSTISRFMLALSVAVMLIWDLLEPSSGLLAKAVDWATLLLQAWAVLLLYGDEARAWFTDKKLRDVA